MLLDGKKHRRPLKANTHFVNHGTSGQGSDAKTSPVVSLGEHPPAMVVNNFPAYEVPVPSVTPLPLMPAATFMAPHSNEMGLSLLEQYNHNSATPSGAVPFHQALSAEMLAIEQQSMAIEQQRIAYDQQCMDVEQPFMITDHQAMTLHQPTITEGQISSGQDSIPANLNDPFFASLSDENWAFFVPKEPWSSPFTGP